MSLQYIGTSHFYRPEHIIRRLLLLSTLCVSIACAQETPGSCFREANPSPGLIKGIIRTGDREGVIVIGGKTVLPGETFTVTTRGVKVVWKVLAVTAGKARFARAVSAAADSCATPPDCRPNYADFLKVLQRGAEAHKAASTSVQKEQILAATRESARLWCASNTLFCVQGTVLDVNMLDDNNARLRLKCADDPNALNHSFFLLRPLSIEIPIRRERAITHKAGDHVLLCGRPVFIKSSGSLIADGMTLGESFASFLILHGGTPIGSLQLSEPRFDIYDPKCETLQ